MFGNEGDRGGVQLKPLSLVMKCGRTLLMWESPWPEMRSLSSMVGSRYNLTEEPDEGVGSVWLRQKAPVIWQVAVGRSDLPGRNEKLQVGPTLVSHLRQPDAIHAAGHVHIGEQHVYPLGFGFKHAEGHVGVPSLYDVVPSIAEHLRLKLTQECLVLDEEHCHVIMVERIGHA